MQSSVQQQNWISGELSPNMRGRIDIPAYANGAERIVNFICETAGPTRYRSGTQYVNNTRRNQIACLIPFQFSDSQAYELEFTEGYIRFFTQNGIVTLTPVNITAATKANPVVVTAVGHSLTNGDEIFISGVVGMTQLNNRSFVVQGISGNTFQLYDSFGTTSINGTGYSTYTSGGTMEKIYEITSPYLLADLFQLKYAQNADVMYMVHSNYEPRKLTRLGATSWTLALFSRTGDPFTSKKVISGITQANPANVTAVAHGLSTGDHIIIETVIGMTQVNSKIYSITKTGADNFTLQTLTGVNVDSTGYTAYSSVGYASLKNLLPGAIAFYQGRLFYGYSDAFPESFWGSKPLDSSGNPQYDDLTVGATVTDGLKFTLSPITGKVDRILSLVPTLNFLAICTFEGISKADGGQAGDPISPAAIDVTPTVTQGVLKEISPMLLGINLVYIHRSALTMYSLEYDIFYNAYNALDKNLTNEHITQSGLIQMVYRNGRPPMFLMVRNDGVLVGVTTVTKENINGGHRHIFGGTNVKVISVGNVPRPNAFDQTWLVNERLINGKTVRYVEYITDEVIIPELSDYFTSSLNATSDDITWRNAMFEMQKQYVFCDANLTYDGSDFATATLTPGAVSGNSVTFTAGSAVFTASMIGRELWKKSINGVGTGRAIITGYTSSTVVTCRITTAFDTVTAMAAGNWYLTTNSISGLWHLEAETVKVITDGGEHADQLVASGTITLQYQASVVHAGLGYIGLLKSMSVEAAGQDGPSQTKPKNVNRVGIRFLNTLGAKYGSSLYGLKEITFRSPSDETGRPAPLFTGSKRVPMEDNTEVEKHFYIVQDKPLPCIILSAMLFVDTDVE